MEKVKQFLPAFLKTGITVFIVSFVLAILLIPASYTFLFIIAIICGIITGTMEGMTRVR